MYEYGTNYNRQTDFIRLFWWFTGVVEPAGGHCHHVDMALLPNFLSWKRRGLNFPHSSAPPVRCIVSTTEELWFDSVQELGFFSFLKHPGQLYGPPCLQFCGCQGPLC